MDDEDDDGTAEEQDEAENDSEHEYDDSYSYSHGRSAQDKNKDSVDELFGWSLFSVPSALASSYQFTSAWPWPNNTVAIEKVLDHRPIPGYHSKLNQSKQYRPLLDEIKDIDAFEYLLKLEGVAYVHARWTRTDGRLSQTQQKAAIDDEMSENSYSFAAAATHPNHRESDQSFCNEVPLRSLKGWRRIENYIASYNELCKQARQLIADDLDQWLIDYQLSRVAFKEHFVPERIISIYQQQQQYGSRQSQMMNDARKDDDIYYLVKWTGLGYDECTWESGSFVTEGMLGVAGQQCVDAFLARRSSSRVPGNGTNPFSRIRPAFAKLSKQPKYLGTPEDLVSKDEAKDNESSNDDEDDEDGSTTQASTSQTTTSDSASQASTIQASTTQTFTSDSASQTSASHSAPNKPSVVLRLRDYQLEGLNWLAYSWSRHHNVILADEMGLGKTIQSSSYLSWLFHSRGINGPFLVVVPLSTIDAWQREIGRWVPALNQVVYLGNAKCRQVIQQYEFYSSNQQYASAKRTVQHNSSSSVVFNVLLTTYELVLKDKDLLGNIKWASLVVDEAHRLKNSASQIHEVLLQNFTFAHKLLITGTPLQNSVRELWCLLAFLDNPGCRISWEDFEARFSSINQASQIAKLHELLRPFILRRLKKDVEKSLPGKNERILRVDMTPNQKNLYRNILARNYKELNRGVTGKQTSLMNIVMELKKASNHAFFYPAVEAEYSRRQEQLQQLHLQQQQPQQQSNGSVSLTSESDLVAQKKTNLPLPESRLEQLLNNSGKLLLLDRLLERLHRDGHRVLIFSQMVQMLDILGEYLSLRRYPFQRLDGSTDNDSRRRSIDHFNAPGSTDFCFLLSTRAGGLGINLETADTVVIFDSDWNPQNDLQAMAAVPTTDQVAKVSLSY